MSDTLVKGTSIELRRTYDAPRAQVFAAWIDAELLKRWYVPVDGWVVSVAEVDPRPGGGYRLEFGPPGEKPVVEIGTYVEFVEGERLVINLRLEGRIASEDTRVVVEFRDRGEVTEVLIVEGEYSSEEVARMHAGGWSHALERLKSVA